MTPSHPLFCHAFLFRTRGAVRASIQGVVQDPGNAPGCESTQAHHASCTWAAKRRSCCSRSILGLWSVPGWWWLRSGSEPAAHSYDCDLLIGSWAPENWGSEWWSPGFPEVDGVRHSPGNMALLLTVLPGPTESPALPSTTAYSAVGS